MTDPEIRALLRPTLPTGLVIDELELRGGAMGHAATLAEIEQTWATVRADVVVVNDLLHGYEVKSAADSRTRLPRQIAAYSAVFDFCTLVTEPKHLRAAVAMLPAWWGVLVVDGDVLREHRPSQRHTPEPGPLIRMLWKEEIRALYRAHGIPLKPREYVHDMWRRADEVPLDALRAAVREAIVERCGPGGLREQRRDQLAAERAERSEEARARKERQRAFVEKLRRDASCS